jgi:hypothetical protein
MVAALEMPAAFTPLVGVSGCMVAVPLGSVIADRFNPHTNETAKRSR